MTTPDQGGQTLAPAGAGNPDRVLAALLFIAASTNAMDVYSALNSSPWTAENFGADPAKAASCREYVRMSIAVTSGYGLAAGLIARSWWPVLGTAAADAFMWWVYERALARGKTSGSSGWAKK